SWVKCSSLSRPVKDGARRRSKSREVAGGLGFEPRLAESESAVLPLDDPPKRRLTLDFRHSHDDSRDGALWLRGRKLVAVPHFVNTLKSMQFEARQIAFCPPVLEDLDESHRPRAVEPVADGGLGRLPLVVVVAGG